jgi:hypothetical protein
MSFPLSIPSGLKVTNSTFNLNDIVEVSESPFSFSEQVAEYSASRWEGSVTLRLMNRSQVAEIQAFLLKLRGRYGTFLYGDPDYLALGARGTASGTPLVNGSGFTQGDTTIAIDGFTASESNVLRAGDYIQFGTGENARLHFVTEDTNSDGSGNASVSFMPALKDDLSDNDPVVITGAKGVFRLTDNVRGWSSDKSSVYSVSFSFTEVV